MALQTCFRPGPCAARPSPAGRAWLRASAAGGMYARAAALLAQQTARQRVSLDSPISQCVELCHAAPLPASAITLLLLRARPRSGSGGAGGSRRVLLAMHTRQVLRQHSTLPASCELAPHTCNTTYRCERALWQTCASQAGHVQHLWMQAMTTAAPRRAAQRPA